MNLPIREFGKTGEEISQLGIGLSEIGRISVQESKNIDKLLNSAIDLGINFFDTAPCYGNSEEFLGRAISHRRRRITSTGQRGVGKSCCSRDPDFSSENRM